MSCAFSREMLALYVEGELSEADARSASSHVMACEACRGFLEQLRATQSLLKSLRRETVSPSECTGMRREVMSIIRSQADNSGWALRMERTIMLAFRQHPYALATFALLGSVSVSVLAQMRHAPRNTAQVAAVFEGRDTLLRPEGYRDWILVGRSPESEHTGGDDSSAIRTHRTYINPSSYQEYERTGRFPEGTLMLWEPIKQDPETKDRPHPQSPALLASVKDSTRFDGGWGFFDFTGVKGTLASKAKALPGSSGCGTCHRHDTMPGHVVTKFYAILRST